MHQKSKVVLIDPRVDTQIQNQPTGTVLWSLYVRCARTHYSLVAVWEEHKPERISIRKSLFRYFPYCPADVIAISHMSQNTVSANHISSLCGIFFYVCVWILCIRHPKLLSDNVYEILIAYWLVSLGKNT